MFIMNFSGQSSQQRIFSFCLKGKKENKAKKKEALRIIRIMTKKKDNKKIRSQKNSFKKVNKMREKI